MKIGINIRHQNGADWNEILEGVTEAERLGFESAFFPDHLVSLEYLKGDDGTRTVTELTSPTGPSDAWTLIAALAPMTTRIRLGTMMTSSTFRHPAMLAMATNHINRITAGSGDVGRLDLGIGAGWHELEHTRYDLPYAPLNQRFDRLTEQVEIITRLWNTPVDDSFDYDGRHYQLRAAGGLDTGTVAPPRLIGGGMGLEKTPRFLARYAEEANTNSLTPEGAAPFFAACDRACEEIGRDPASLRKSVLFFVVLGTDDNDVERSLQAARLTRSQLFSQRVCRPDELTELLLRWKATDVDRVIVSRPGAVDLPSLQLLGEEVLPHLS